MNVTPWYNGNATFVAACLPADTGFTPTKDIKLFVKNSDSNKIRISFDYQLVTSICIAILTYKQNNCVFPLCELV